MVFVPPLTIGKSRNGGVLLTPLSNGKCWKDSLCTIYKGAEHLLGLLQVKIERWRSKKFNLQLAIYTEICHLKALSERCAPYCAIGS
jgi:hypothetical protein